MRAARLMALVLTCVLAATVAGAAVGKTKPKHHKPAAFNKRYDCSKAVPVKLIDTYLRSWEGNVALKGKAVKNTYSDGGGSACTYKYADGPFAGKVAGSIVVAYGVKNAPHLYKSSESAAKHNTAGACANGNPSGDPRVCGPVELTGVGTHAYECSSAIAAVKGKIFVSLGAGSGVANGQYVPSSTLPPADALKGAMKAILARLS
jgi:hypothetical protein